MAENITPVQLSVQDFETREVMMIDYKFDQATDREGQLAGIPRGGKITIRVKAMNDGNNQLLQWMLAPNDPRDLKVTFCNTIDGSTMKELQGKGCSWFCRMDRFHSRTPGNNPILYRSQWGHVPAGSSHIIQTTF